jgi:hypothetical protein
MDHDLDPVVGNWYKHVDRGQTFRVVGIDEEEELVSIQHFDGDLEQIELRAWFDMDIEPAAPPEDWTGPVDDVETDDLGFSETGMSAADWRDDLEGEEEEDEDWDEEEEEDEDWGDGGDTNDDR